MSIDEQNMILKFFNKLYKMQRTADLTLATMLYMENMKFVMEVWMNG